MFIDIIVKNFYVYLFVDIFVKKNDFDIYLFNILIIGDDDNENNFIIYKFNYNWENLIKIEIFYLFEIFYILTCFVFDYFFVDFTFDFVNLFVD